MTRPGSAPKSRPAPGGAAPGSDGPLIALTTRCVSLDEFVQRFAPYATEGALVMPASAELAVGIEGRFVIRLKDQSVVMRGGCRVVEVKRATNGAPGAAGRVAMRVQLLDMDDASRGIHRRLLASQPRASPPPPPPPVPPVPALPPRWPPPLPIAPTVLAVVPPPPPVAVPEPIVDAKADETLPSPVPAPETRAPGAPDTLPANPLSEVAAADLSSFIDCMLLEAEGDPVAAEAIPLAGKDGGLAEQTAHVARAISHALPPRAVRAAPYVLCIAVGVLAGAVLRRSPPAPPAGRGARPGEAAGAGVAASPSSRPPRAAASVPAPAPAPVPGPAPAPAAAPSCLASVSTQPEGASVSWDERLLGRSPIRNVRVPCGAGEVQLRHERYQAVVRTVTVSSGDPAVIAERLRRPAAALVLSSSPAHARITINAQPLGTAPRKLGLLRFEHFRIKASLPGYQPWSRTIYLRDPLTQLNVQLVPLSSPSRATARR